MRDLPFIPLPTTSSAAELSRLPREVRLPAMFSARMNLVAPLVEMGAQAQGILDGTVSESDARLAIRNALAAAGYEPPMVKGEDNLLDHTSKTRLDLILEMNVRKGRGFAKRVADMDDDALYLFPAQQLVRVRPSRSPRSDWAERFTDAGGIIRNGKMVALKTDPVWANLSRFGEPFPPFDFGSGMGVADIDRDEAVRLGLLKEDEELTPDPPQMPAFAQGLPGIEGMPALREAVKTSMQDLASFNGDTLTILDDAVPPTPTPETLDDASIHASPTLVQSSEARSLLQRSLVVEDPDGNAVIFGSSIWRHWKRGYNAKVANKRVKTIRYAFDAVREPQEKWITERSGKSRMYYLKTFRDTEGIEQRTVVVRELDGKVVTWLTNASHSRIENAHRKGEFIRRLGDPKASEKKEAAGA